MRRARLKRSSAANPFCHCVPVCPSVRPMIMCVTGLFLCLPLTGRVLGRCHQRHRHQEFLAFLGRIDAAFSDDGKSQLHLIIDNYSTHKTPKVHRWLLRHPRFHLHFTPTGSSWLNMVERFFARITTEAIRRGSFSS